MPSEDRGRRPVLGQGPNAGRPRDSLRSVSFVDERRSGAWFETVLDAVEHMVLVKGENSRLLWANRAFRDYYGMTVEELEGTVDGPQSSVDHTLQYVRDDHQVFTTGRTLDIPAEPVTDHRGRTRMFHTVKSAVVRDGVSVGTVGISTLLERMDDTAAEYVQSRAVNAGFTRQLRGFVSTLPQPIALLDKQQQLVSVSEAWSQAFGEPGADLDDLPSFGALYGDRLGLSDAVSEAFASSTSSRLDAHPVRAEGGPRFFDVGIHPWVFPSGPTGGVIIVANEVTSLRRSELELTRSNRDLERFAYVASHDLKSPLHGVSQLVRFIQEDLGALLQGEVAENFELLQGRVTRMRTFLDDLLRYSRAGAEEPWVAVDLRRITRELIEDLDGSAENIDVHLELEQAVLPETGLRQILQNLLQNAIAHGGAGSARVGLRAFAEPGEVSFEVHDRGPGIDPAYHDQIFDMFQTLKPRDRQEGSGIGLSIVRRVLERHRGTVRVESPTFDGGGTRFVVTFPSAQVL